ncbi:hypothetical protein AAVH_39720, partial [Aphelenchoides avenae]
MSSTDSATHTAFLRDTFSRIIDGEHLPPKTLTQAYTSVYNWIEDGPTPHLFGDNSPAHVEAYDYGYSPVCVLVYNFLRDSIFEHIHTK